MNTPPSLRIILAALVILITTSAAQAQQLAITWDDLPAHSALPQGETRVEIGRKLIAAMKDAHLPSIYGFVNGIAIEREPASAPMLKDWRDAGFLLGNHTWSHMNLNTSSVADWEADLVKNEPVLQQYATSSDWHWLRYPFLAEGDTPEKRADTRKYLAAHGYKIAAVTMSFGDYMWNEPYALLRCKERHRFPHRRNSNPAIFKPPPRTLTSAAPCFRKPSSATTSPTSSSCTSAPSMLTCCRACSSFYRDKGFTFVTLQQAEKDPFYSGAIDPSLPDQPDSLEATMHARNLPLPAPSQSHDHRPDHPLPLNQSRTGDFCNHVDLGYLLPCLFPAATNSAPT